MASVSACGTARGDFAGGRAGREANHAAKPKTDSPGKTKTVSMCEATNLGVKLRGARRRMFEIGFDDARDVRSLPEIVVRIAGNNREPCARIMRRAFPAGVPNPAPKEREEFGDVAHGN